jgi:hypothetical protein
MPNTPLTPQEQTVLRAMLSGRGGNIDGFVANLRTMAIADMKTATVSTLASALSLTITSWPAVATVIAAGSSTTIYPIMADIATAIAAQNSAALGPLLIGLYGAVKDNLQL